MKTEEIIEKVLEEWMEEREILSPEQFRVETAVKKALSLRDAEWKKKIEDAMKKRRRWTREELKKELLGENTNGN